MRSPLFLLLSSAIVAHGTVLTFTINDVLHDQPIPSPAGAHKMAECFPGYGSNVNGPYEITDDYIVLEIHHIQGPGTGFGMDDMDFDQAPPPPSEGK